MAARRAGIAALALALLAGGAQARVTGPSPTARPTVSGTLEAGARLTAGAGTWTSQSAVAYAYQWYRCDANGAHCGSIHGATAAGLVLARKDVGRTIGLTVTATDTTGSSSAYASLVGPVAAARPVLVSTAQPQMTGLAVEGQALQVTTGAWSPVPATLSYSWRRCNANGRVCLPIPGAGASAYTVTAADVGHALLADVEATFGTTTRAALSTATGAVLGRDVRGPASTVRPAITGVAETEAQLTASTGRWEGSGAIRYAYQWYRCDADGAHCSSVRGATTTTYTTVAADAGKTLGFTVRATDATGTARGYASLFGPVAPPHAPLTAAAAPDVLGAVQAGSTLAVGTGGWRPHPKKLTYAWRRCNANGRICNAIPRATAATYTVAGADVGHVLVAVVTARRGADSQSAYSVATPAVP
jgi:hypothetical protein